MRVWRVVSDRNGLPFVERISMSDQADSRQRAHIYEGALGEVGAILDRLSARRVFFVVDESAYVASGASEILAPFFKDRSVAKFADFELNPKLNDVERGIVECREAKPDVVIALGGGTAIDLAKMIGTLAAQEVSARKVVTDEARIERKGPPLIVVPTTSGTGSEATHFAVVYVDGQKVSLAHSYLLPDYALVDATLTHSAPAHITGPTGLDAFCQAVESLWAVGATEESIEYASESLALSVRHLEVAVSRPTAEARLGMSEAAHLGGKAINISKTTAPHALSYAITSDYGVPHGAAVALNLGALLEYNANVTETDCSDPRGPKHVRDQIAHIVEILGVKTVLKARGKIDALIERIGCPTLLNKVGIEDDAAIARLVEQVNVERLANNPRRIDAIALFDCLKERH
jgi:alcohol dehydrogenase class IV